MKITYFKIKDTDQDVPEYYDSIDILMKDKPHRNVDTGMFIALRRSEPVGKTTSEFILFSDQKTIDDFISAINEFELLIEIQDITSDVKHGKCTNLFFIELFSEEDGNFNNLSQLEDYIELYTTQNDVLEKITKYGIESISDFDKTFLFDFIFIKDFSFLRLYHPQVVFV